MKIHYVYLKSSWKDLQSKVDLRKWLCGSSNIPRFSIILQSPLVCFPRAQFTLSAGQIRNQWFSKRLTNMRTLAKSKIC